MWWHPEALAPAWHRAWSFAFHQFVARLVALLAGFSQRHRGIDPERQALFFPDMSVLHKPVLAACCRDFQVHAMPIGQTDTGLPGRTDGPVTFDFGQSHGGTFAGGIGKSRFVPPNMPLEGVGCKWTPWDFRKQKSPAVRGF